jgi:hypothetical protein
MLLEMLVEISYQVKILQAQLFKLDLLPSQLLQILMLKINVKLHPMENTLYSKPNSICLSNMHLNKIVNRWICFKHIKTKIKILIIWIWSLRFRILLNLFLILRRTWFLIILTEDMLILQTPLNRQIESLKILLCKTYNQNNNLWDRQDFQHKGHNN